jgi:tRNA (adenine37-N6)-methyltransferase
MFHYRITKYDPALRNALGHFKGDDWTSSADIGRSFDGQTLTTARYLEIESFYIDAIEHLAAGEGAEQFMVCGYHPSHDREDISDDALRHDTEMRLAELGEGFVLINHGRYPVAQLATLARMILRERLWTRLELGASSIHFGYDYYMYASARTDIFGLGDAPYVRWGSLYIEPMRSPYEYDAPLHMSPIGYVEAARVAPEDDRWGASQATIELTDDFEPEALQGLDAFSHVEVLFFFHGVEPDRVVSGARHPRNNKDWPKVGIFAQRGKARPNRIGSTICRVVRVEGTRLIVAELDAIDGTPVLDLKPIMGEFLPRGEVRQPEWSHELMRAYWDEDL